MCSWMNTATQFVCSGRGSSNLCFCLLGIFIIHYTRKEEFQNDVILWSTSTDKIYQRVCAHSDQEGRVDGTSLLCPKQTPGKICKVRKRVLELNKCPYIKLTNVIFPKTMWYRYCVSIPRINDHRMSPLVLLDTWQE